jgi:hypothetical protein
VLAKFGAFNLEETSKPKEIDLVLARKAAAQAEIDLLQNELKTLKKRVLSAMLREIPALAWYLGRPVTTVRKAYQCQRLYLQPPPPLAETAAALAQWRSTRRRSSRIPEELWSQATELAERYGIAKVAVALKLDYKSLKHRLTARNAAEDARSAPVSSSFVELSISACRWRHLCASWFSPTERAARAAHRTATSGQQPHGRGRV